MKIERTRIHFFSDVALPSPSSDLKVPTNGGQTVANYNHRACIVFTKKNCAYIIYKLLVIDIGNIPQTAAYKLDPSTCKKKIPPIQSPPGCKRPPPPPPPSLACI